MVPLQNSKSQQPRPQHDRFKKCEACGVKLAPDESYLIGNPLKPESKNIVLCENCFSVDIELDHRHEQKD